MPVPPFVIYIAACIALAWLGRNRILGFWGYLILALAAPPAAALIVFAGGPRPVRPSPPTKPTVE